MKGIGFVLAMLVSAFPVNSFADDRPSHPGDSKGSAKIHELIHESSQKMSQMKMSGDVDKDFAATMADHHRHGIEMAEVEIANGKDPELKKARKGDDRVSEKGPRGS